MSSDVRLYYWLSGEGSCTTTKADFPKQAEAQCQEASKEKRMTLLSVEMEWTLDQTMKSFQNNLHALMQACASSRRAHFFAKSHVKLTAFLFTQTNMWAHEKLCSSFWQDSEKFSY